VTEANLTLDLDQIMTCFQGIKGGVCTSNVHQNELVNYEVSDFPFLWDSNGGGAFCLECCGNSRLEYQMEETYGVSCALDDQDVWQNHVDKYSNNSFEFRFGRRRELSDDTVVRCDLERVHPSQYVVGYVLSLWVVEYGVAVGGYWRGVENCTAIAIESNSLTSSVFQQNISLFVNYDDSISSAPRIPFSFVLIVVILFIF